jgi:uncharacterized NAD(P)/FAD-binding protein YdhS
MRSDREFPVAIIGGGFSGTILAAQLARRGIRSALIDGSGRVGRGVAYSTREPAHLLNVRAEGMSAWAGEPDDFARRFESEGGERRGFAERRFFARYLADILEEAIATGQVNVVEASAKRASSDGEWLIEFADREPIRASALVLAIGNQEPEPLNALGAAGDRYIANPWGANARAAVEELAASGDSALLVGTGLTMVDLVLSLDAAGYRGRITALARRGQIPRSHADFEPAPVAVDELPVGNLRALWRWLRERSARFGWRAAVDSLRPHSQALWQSLDHEQQRRFLRHARPWWDVHRHRIAPEVAQTVARMVGDGRLEILAGRVVTTQRDGDELDVTIRRRGSSTPQTMRFAYAFNCTGPLHSVGRTRDPLLRSLLDAGQVRPDHLGIGLEVDQRSRAEPGERLWALGPLTKGRYWEIIAVPDIREQAAAVADDIARELENEPSI